MRRRDVCLAAAGAAISACATSCAKRTSTGLRTIDVGVDNHPSVSPFYLAVERGYFRDAGIDARPQLAGGSAQAVSLLAAGRLHAVLAPAGPSLFNVTTKGLNVRVVLGRERVTNGCGTTAALYARRSSFPSGTGDIRQWSGKRISSGKGAGLPEFFLDTILSRSGLNPEQTEHRRMTETQSYAALVSGAIDGILHGNNARLEFGSDAGIVREDAGRKLLEGMQVSHILFGPDLLERDTSVGGRFLACYLRGVKDFETGATPRFLEEYVAAQSGRQSILGQCRDYNSPGGTVDRGSLAEIQQWAIRRGYTAAGAPVDSLIDERFLDWAHLHGADNEGGAA